MGSLLLLSGSPALLVGPAVHTPARASVRMAALDGEQLLLAKFGLPADAFQTDRRQALGLGLAALAAVGTAAPAMAQDPMFTLPPLPYPYVRAPTAQPTAASRLRRLRPPPCQASAKSHARA